MAVGVTSCSLSLFTPTLIFRSSLTSQPRSATLQISNGSITPKASNHRSRPSNPQRGSSSSSSSSSKSSGEKNIPGRSKDGRPNSYADGNGGREDIGRAQSTSVKSLGMQRKDKKDIHFDIRQQVEPENLQNLAFLNAVVKVYCTHTTPDYSLPWQKQRQYTSTGSAFIIGDGKLLTNAHCVEHDTQVKVKKRGDDTKYVAKVLARGIDCDIALLSVESKEFWEGAESLNFGRLPCLQDAVTVVGYPLGGDTISVTKGVVSRIEVTSYAHGSSDLLGIQIDAAINPVAALHSMNKVSALEWHFRWPTHFVPCVQGLVITGSQFHSLASGGTASGPAPLALVYRSEAAENIGYVIPTTVVSHFLKDYERNGKYTGFPSLGIFWQKLENPALRACLKVQSNEGVLVRRVEPISDANNVLKEGDVIVSFDDIRIGCEGTVPFRSRERIAFRYLVSQKFAGDVAELGIIRAGKLMGVNVVLNPRVHLVPYHIDGDQPSYIIIAGFVFTTLSEPLIDEECEDSIGLKLLAKASYSLARFKGERIVILSQVLANKANIGYEDMSSQQVLKFNGTRIKNIHHLAHLIDSCKDQDLVFEFEDNYIAVLERKAATAALPCILKDYGIPSERSSDLLEPYVDLWGDNQATIDQDLIAASPVSNLEIGIDGLLWT